MKLDSQIAHETKLLPTAEIGMKINIPQEALGPYGKYMAKVPYTLIDEEGVKKASLIMVTSITPTKTDNGKTTVSVGFALSMNRLGKKAVVALREPSLGPCFGMKGGAADGGYAQVPPMEKINLHFTGNFHAITSANNMISALLDDYCYQNQNQGFAPKEVLWRRVLDVSNRNLRNVVTGLGYRADGVINESGFDITPASEIMVILCLAKDEEDLQRRVEDILLGFTPEDKPFTVKDLGVAGVITTLLHDATHPNLVQTTEHAPAFIHGGPFASIAHGCNSMMATKTGMTFGDYVITEAGFGADLGAEKFLDIERRKAGLSPELTVLVVTAQALKLHGGIDVTEIKQPYPDGIRQGLTNTDKHIANMQAFGQNVVVCINRFPDDTDEELALIQEHRQELGVSCIVNTAYADDGRGAGALAQLVIDTIDEHPSAPLKLLYNDDESIEEKVCKVAQRIYGVDDVVIEPAAKRKLAHIAVLGYTHFLVCTAKTQYSFSEDAKAYDVPIHFKITIRDFVINTGTEIIMAIAGSIMRMSGLPRSPQAERLYVEDSVIQGLS